MSWNLFFRKLTFKTSFTKSYTATKFLLVFWPRESWMVLRITFFCQKNMYCLTYIPTMNHCLWSMPNQKPKNIILFFRQELASITVLPNHTKCPVWKPKKSKYCTKLQINTNLGNILIKFLIFRNIIIQRGDFPSKFLDFISLTCFRVFPQYRLHTCKNLILMVVTRAMANSSKNHALLMCRIWKLGWNLFSSLDIRENPLFVLFPA